MSLQALLKQSSQPSRSGLYLRNLYVNGFTLPKIDARVFRGQYGKPLQPDILSHISGVFLSRLIGQPPGLSDETSDYLRGTSFHSCHYQTSLKFNATVFMYHAIALSHDLHDHPRLPCPSSIPRCTSEVVTNVPSCSHISSGETE